MAPAYWRFISITPLNLLHGRQRIIYVTYVHTTRFIMRTLKCVKLWSAYQLYNRLYK